MPIVNMLHAVPAIKESFKVQLKKGFKSRFNKSECKEIIKSVCHLNRAMYDVSQMVSDDTNLLLWPCIDTGEEIDPLRDVRVVEVLYGADVEQFCITPLEVDGDCLIGRWGMRLRVPWNMTTNTRGEILVLFRDLFGKPGIEVFSSSGEHILPAPMCAYILPIRMTTFTS